MNKLIFLFAMMFLMIGVVSADRVISDLDDTFNVPLTNVVAGSEFEASFSFDYISGGENVDGSPLIIQLNISSDDETYPVNKDEFWVSGFVEKSFFEFTYDTIAFECSEVREQTIEHPQDAAFVVADNGTFYCYNEEGDLSLNEKDDITLKIVSHQAIYPGKYDLSAKLFYLEDERAPFVTILNTDDFEKWYRENDDVSIEVKVVDGSLVSQVYGIADLISDTMNFVGAIVEGNVYSFQKNTPVDVEEGDYDLFVYAEDEYGNVGKDNVTLKIDRSAPVIGLVGFVGEVVSGILSVNVSVVDDKSGTDGNSVEYRLREMSGENICPEDGVGTWDCYNSDWTSLPLDSEGLFSEDIDTSGLNGEYWLQIRASDVLGNMGVLE